MTMRGRFRVVLGGLKCHYETHIYHRHCIKNEGSAIYIERLLRTFVIQYINAKHHHISSPMQVGVIKISRDPEIAVCTVCL